jgi:fatty acid desaturase
MAVHNMHPGITMTQRPTTYEFSIAIRERLRPLHRLNNWREPLAVTADYAVIGAAIWMSQRLLWLLPLSILIIGSRQRALGSVLHDSCHHILARNRRWNGFIGHWFGGLPIFQSYHAYRNSHVLRHHGHLGNPERDPDYRQYIECGLFEVRDRLDFLRYVVNTLLLLNMLSYLKYLIHYRFAAIRKSRRECLGLLLVQVTLATILWWMVGPAGYVIYWIVPLLTSFQVIGVLSEIAEHYPRIRTARLPLQMTRNRFPSRVERFLIGMHGDNYHLVHHLFVGIPSWNLAKAHTILMDDQEYRFANESVGGIFSAPPGRLSILQSILEEIQQNGSPRFVALGHDGK